MVPLIQNSASVVYVKEQMGHSSIQATVDISAHLIPGANASFARKLDGQDRKTTVQLPRKGKRGGTKLPESAGFSWWRR